MLIKPIKSIHISQNINLSMSAKKMTKFCRAWSKEEFDFWNKKQNNTILENPIIKIPFSELTNKFLEKIKRKFVFPQRKNDKKEFLIPYIQEKYNIEDSKKNAVPAYQENLITNKRDLIKNIIGINTITHWEKVKNNIQKFPITNADKLIKKKIKITKIFTDYLNKNTDSYNFIYTKAEINYLKNLAVEYDTIETILNKNKIFTKNIETLLFSNSKLNTYSIGSKTENRDLIIKEVKIFDKEKNENTDALLTFSNTEKGIRFKIYKADKNIIQNKDKIQKQFFYFLKNNKTDKINQMNAKIGKSLLNSEIAEVFLDIKNKNELNMQMSESNLFTQKEIDELLKNNTRFYYLHDLKNFNPNKYYNVSIALINCLKEFGIQNNIKRAFIEALAFGKSKHSPVSLYLRYGCVPLSDTKENLEKDIFSKKGVDYTKNIWLKVDI